MREHNASELACCYLVWQSGEHVFFGYLELFCWAHEPHIPKRKKKRRILVLLLLLRFLSLICLDENVMNFYFASVSLAAGRKNTLNNGWEKNRFGFFHRLLRWNILNDTYLIFVFSSVWNVEEVTKTASNSKSMVLFFLTRVQFVLFCMCFVHCFFHYEIDWKRQDDVFQPREKKLTRQ